ncbi:type II toxin-antitoxin system RelE/ParE family toxin [Bradyrhizobium guangzhouense]|uniref:Type II toxin-antitoxin system RelE/ParE family toxin n=1 Tax=Bradyrhizobium guangzhouense TaxID=1325095 RepID=A0AAE6CBJ4_9BRAD|nr:type II toxin-antitoxin system RelE/ParE family toxin [Bradyrhizobium guangzhouense]QAU49826.1 type II toxin-antitoxin system RelE/ParE family toxin [Bradyrhizobium guangzhouense]RXH17913.1 type II toxin-antitoxin system RelE/ParE family toxin [Bradyrhizobium guangzhouense]RXH20463.1 type II toxin-antitoxin system RelE/ParE family toxin [Bradyrhizobium guangzhouense]
MPVYQLKTFARFARGEKIAAKRLLDAIERAERGLVDADLGGGLIKQRVARQGQGRSGGYRMMIAFRAKDFSLFLFGFAKSDESNVDDRQLAVLRRIATAWLSADAASITKAVQQGELIEVTP